MLESIQKGYPAGTMLLLKVASAEESPFGSRPFDGAPDPTAELEYLVLDGQQRMGTCYSALRAIPGQMTFAMRLRELYEKTGGEPRQPIEFAELLLRRNTQFLEQMLYGSHLLPIPFLGGDPDEFRERLASYREQLLANDGEAAYASFIDRYLQGYVQNFFGYRFPCVVLDGRLDLEAVCTIFTKINSTGLKLSAFDLCVATLFPKGIELRQLLDDAKAETAVSLVDDDGTNILQTIALLAGVSSKKAALPKTITAEHIHTFWGKAVAGLNAAADLLVKLGCWSFKSNPYDAMVPALAAAIEAKGLAITNAQVQESLRAKVGRWLYQSALAQRYNEGTDVKQAQDYAAVLAWLSGEASDPPAFLEQPAVWTADVSRTGTGGARARALYLALNEAAPHDLMTGARVGHGAGRTDSQLHHIFPTAFLKRTGAAPKAGDLALNLTFLTGDANRFISDRPPSEYVSEMIHRRATNDGVSETVARSRVKSAFAEHWVDAQAFDALIADDYDAFLNARASAYRDHLATRFGVAVIEAVPEDEEEAEEEELVESLDEG